jgi:hypothetical protein
LKRLFAAAISFGNSRFFILQMGEQTWYKTFGLRTALTIGAAGMLTALLWVIFSPIARLAGLPPAAEEENLAVHAGK